VLVAAFAAAGLVAGCASPQPKAMVAKGKSKEYFAESEYGVKASPRVSTERSGLPRGGGREQVGKPYKIKGKWYYPKEQPDYSKQGKASWYGDAFHGRLTANGEIYDMTHLTAAHPTMPLPSYARVTNMKNGASVMVRVNDRGPYAHGRIIDLSRRAAEMLDYTHSGIAEVRVDYVGRAPLDGHDDEYLLASYRPGTLGPDPSDGMPTGVMIAMAGPTPTLGVDSATAAASAFPGTMTASGATAGAPVATDAGNFDFPEFGPVIVDRPLVNTGAQIASAGQFEVLSYAEQRIETAFSAFETIEGRGEATSWKDEAAAPGSAHIAVGTFADAATAEFFSRTLSSYGRAEIERSKDGQDTWYSVSLSTDGRADINLLLERSWASGAADAFIVRD
jgi:rare lipoprotein A